MSQIITHEKIETTNSSGVNYDDVLKQFGCSTITPEILHQIKQITGTDTLHPFLERSLFYAHRDLDKILQKSIKNGTNDFYLYTGRGPSSESLHIGHLIPFIMTKHLQQIFDVPVIIQITDDEKYFHSKNHTDTLELYQTYAMKNIHDIIACDFNPDKTFIFLNSTFSNYMVHNLAKIQKKINLNQIQSTFGYGLNDNMGRVSFPVCQMVPAFASSFPSILSKSGSIVNDSPINMFNYKYENPNTFNDCLKQLRNKQCLVVAAVDQDPYFRMLRDIATKIGEPKPAVIYSKFLASLLGKQTKMSSSVINSAIYLDDTPKQIKKKINKFAFSGGQETLELQKELGGNPDVDVSFQYLEIFCSDTKKIEQIREDYKSGNLMTGKLKQSIIELLTNMLTDHQNKKQKITDEVVQKYMTPRSII